MTKGELRKMIQEVLREEFLTGSYLTEAYAPADSLIATHVCQNPDFETACMTGDAAKILAIFDEEMKKNNLYTAGAKKLRTDVARMTRGMSRVPVKIGENILFFVWNSQASGTGFATENKPKY
jgi:hypothetical protein